MAAANLGSGAMQESEARKYLTDKSIMALFEKLCASLVVNQPDDPQKFLIAQLERLQRGEDVLGVPKSKPPSSASGEPSSIDSTNDTDSAAGSYDDAVVKKLVSDMFTAENNSLVKQHLTQEIYDQLSGLKSKEVGYTIDDAVKTAVDNQDSGVGIYAGDEDSYHVFAPIFDKVIETYHGGYKPSDKHKSDMNPDNLTAPEVKFDDYVISTRIRVGRNVTGYGLSPGIPQEQRKELEELVAKALSKLGGELSGTYYPLQGMDEETRQKLVDDHFLFKKGDRFLESCGANRDWPEGRGIYHNDQKTFLVWVNEEDNLRIISMEQGADFVGVFKRLAAGIKAIEEVLDAEGKSYQFNDHHGFIHSCPSNLGTGMRASVHIRLPKLSADVEKFYARCAELKLQPRGIHGEHSETTDGIYDLSNKHRIGYTEVELVQTMIDGVQQLIKEEAALGGDERPTGIGESDAKQVSDMFTAENSSLVKQHLTQEIYDELKDIKSKEVGYTIDDAIKTAVDNQDSGVGIYAGDEDSYHVFAPIFDKVIETYHGGYKPSDKHKSDMHADNLKAPEEKFDDYVISTRIRVGRNVTGYGLSPGIPREQRKELEELVAKALSKLDGDLAGTYYPLAGMDEQTRQQLVDDHFLFKKGDRFLESCGANRDWPEGRGIYHNDKKTFLVWVNEEDNLRIISMEQGADFVGVFKRLAAGIKAIEEVLGAEGKSYQFNDHHGFIHSCPSNLGTGMRASVHIKVPKLSADIDKFKARCAELKLQPRGVHGEHSETTDGIYDLSNKHRIGYTEVELVQTMIDGVQQLIKEEAALATGDDEGASDSKQVSDMFTAENNSLVKQHLTQEIYDHLKGLKSKEVGYTIDDAIKTSVDNQDSGVGIYAGDENSYHVFAPIFDKVIETYHGGYKPEDKHKSDMEPENLKAPEEKFDDYVISTRIRVGRNITGYGLSPGIPRQQRKELEELVAEALSKLEGELSGTYYPLQGMDEETRQKLVDDHFLFKKGDRFLESCGANRDWPEGRGIYHNDQKTFLVWVNEEDNLRIISMEQGADFVGVFKRLAAGIKAIEEVLSNDGKGYQFNDHHGFIHSCPSNLGTGMRASVHIKLPKLSADQEKFKARCAELKLQPRGVHGEHSETTDGIYDLSNKHRIGYTEVELVQTMIDGVQQLIKEEAACE